MYATSFHGKTSHNRQDKWYCVIPKDYLNILANVGGCGYVEAINKYYLMEIDQKLFKII